jgi:hypothetical protein
LSSEDPSLKATSHSTLTDPDRQEVAPGADHQKLEGWVPELASPDELRVALEHAFDYRGDVLVTCKDGTTIEGYIFDRRTGRTLEDSLVRILPKNGGGKTSVRYADIAALAFSGRDMAAGKNWENWVRQYWERKAAGEEGISLQPEELE